MAESEYLTPEEAAKLLRISMSTLWRRLADKTIPSIKLGKVVRIRRSDLEAALAAPPPKAPSAPRRPTRRK